MPYIKKSEREKIDPWLDPVLEIVKNEANDCEINAGEMNYIITKLCDAYVGDCKGYETYNAVIGFLEACKLEYYRKVISPYEDNKIRENGPVQEVKSDD